MRIVKKKPSEIYKSNIVGEIWRSIPMFPDHEVSNLGHVRRITKTNIKAAGEYLTPDVRGRHLYVNITRKYEEYEYNSTAYISLRVSIAALMLKLFEVKRPTELHSIAYRDGDKTNLALDNIIWATGKKLTESRRHLFKGKTGPQPYDRIPHCVAILRNVFYLAEKRKFLHPSKITFDKASINRWLKGTIKPFHINNAIEYLMSNEIIIRTYDPHGNKAHTYCISPNLESEMQVWEKLSNYDGDRLKEFGINSDYEDVNSLYSWHAERNTEQLNELDSDIKKVDKEYKHEILEQIPIKTHKILVKIPEKEPVISQTGSKALDFDVYSEYSSENVQDFLTAEDLIEEVEEED